MELLIVKNIISNLDYISLQEVKIKAIILAAGSGSRLMPYTQNVPKCLIEHGGSRRTFLEHQLGTLRSAGIKDVIIVTGYLSHKIEKACEKFKDIKFTFFRNLDYENSGTLNSMSLAREEFNDDLIVLNSDIIYTKRCLKNVMNCPEVCVSMEIDRTEQGATCILVNEDNVLDMGFLDIHKASGLSVGIVKFPKKYMEDVKNFLTDYPRDTRCFVFNLVKYFIGKVPVKSALCEFGNWCEIDTPEDLKLYKDTIDILLG